MKKNNHAGCIALFCAALFVGAFVAEAAEKPLPTVYWMSIATTNQTMPGMPREIPAGMLGGLGGGPKKTMLLQMNSPRQLPPNPAATHDIPVGMSMGATLPLMIPQQEKPQRHDYEQAEERVEKERMRILVYWGCNDTVRPGQPKVIDTASMSPGEISRAMRTGVITAQVPPAPGRMRIYAEWPNLKNSLQVPSDSSLVGEHFVNGNYTPDIRFAIGSTHDFLAPVEFNGLTGGLSDSIVFNWRRIPNSLGYFSTVMAHTKNKEMIVWSSSESYMLGWQLMDYVSSPDARRLVRDRIVMKPDQISCRIPKGIFSNADGAMLQFIAYGEDLHFGYPPKPKDPIWGVRVRSKSTGMIPLGMETDQRSGRGRSDETQADTPQLKEQPETERPSGPNPLNTIRGLFGF